MTNLLTETVRFLQEYGLSLKDILFVTDGCNCHMATENYLRQLLDIDYDDGYGMVEINHRLKLVGVNFWLERWEYDGSEGWSLKKKPEYQSTTFSSIMVRE